MRGERYDNSVVSVVPFLRPFERRPYDLARFRPFFCFQTGHELAFIKISSSTTLVCRADHVGTGKA